MDIHEYQAKEILSSFGVTVPRGGIVYSPETAENKAREIICFFIIVIFLLESNNDFFDIPIFIFNFET